MATSAQGKIPFPDLTEADTYPKMLRRHYLEHGDKPALRKKRYGIWRTYTWKDYYENVKYFSLGIVSLGFERGQKVTILGDNDPEWWYSALGTQAAGGVQYGIFVDCIPSEVQYFTEVGEAVFVVAKDQEQVDKMLEIRDQLPLVKKVIYWEPKGMWIYDDPYLIDFQELLQLGREYEETHPDLFDQNVDQGQGSDVGCLCFTSGTTGMPKAAMLSYETHCLVGRAMWEHFPMYPGEDYFSFLCPAWGLDQLLGIGMAMVSGMVVNFPEEPDTVKEDAREIDSQFQAAGARAWEENYRNIQVRLADADFLKRFFYKLFLPVGYRIADLRYENKEPGLLLKALFKIGDWLVFRPIRDKVGVTRARICMVAGAMMSPELFRYWRAVGVPLYTNYGSTEGGIASMEVPGHMRVGSSGRTMPFRELKVVDGEILIKHDGQVFTGYYKNPDATAEKIKDGWVYSGDSGWIDEDGYLFFIDRLDDLSTLADGNKFSPTYIEASLRFSAFIKDVFIVGLERDHVSALIDIDLGNCGKWAEKEHIAYTTRVDLSQKQEICDLIQGEIETVNRMAPEHSRVKRFVNLHKEFDPDEAEMTRTRKLKRNVLEDKYKDIVDAIYTPGAKEVKVRTEVKYRDGRKGTIDTELRVNTI